MREKTACLAAAAILLAISAQPSAAQETAYPVTIENGDYTFTVEAPPERAVGVGIPDAVRQLARGFYPELFEQ